METLTNDLICELSKIGLIIQPNEINTILQTGIDFFLAKHGVDLESESLTKLHLILNEIRSFESQIDST